MDSPSPTLGFHLEHPPKRTVSLFRSKELHSLAIQRVSITIELPMANSPPPEIPIEREIGSPDSVMNTIDDIERGVTADNPIAIPSALPHVSCETTKFSPDHARVVKLEPDEDLDFHIPLMTSLFYQEEINWAGSINQRLHRNASINSTASFPRDAFSWYPSPDMTPHTASPCISPPRASSPHEIQNLSTKGLRASSDSIQSFSFVQTAAALSHDDSAQTSSKRRNSHSRRTRRAKRDPSRLRSTSSPHLPKSTTEADNISALPSVWVAQSKPSSNLMSGKHPRSRQLPLPPLIPPRSPIRRPLPPKPQPIPSAPAVLPRHNHSFPSPRDSGVAGLISLVDEMIIDVQSRLIDRTTAITAH